MAGAIRIISKNSVFAASQGNLIRSRIELTPWDLQMLLFNYSERALLFHKPNFSEEKKWQNTFIHHLKTSLSRTLDFFPPLAGRLATVDHGCNTISCFINCNNAGAEFVHAVADGVSVADIVGPVYVPGNIIHSCFTLKGLKNFEGTSQPLLAVQVTELEDGILIGCTTNHIVVDASSAWHFLKSWSEISRGFDSLSKSPVLQRFETDYPILIPELRKEQEVLNMLSTLPLQLRVFHFSSENIAKLKAKANAEIGTNTISSFQALISHVWRSVIRNQYPDDLEQDVNCRLSVDVRSRLQPPLPQGYFGNAIQVDMVTLKARELIEQGLGHAAWQMNKKIVTYKGEEKVRDFLESWKRKPQFVKWGGMASNVSSISIASSPKFDVYGNDFGWGKPIAARNGPSGKKNGRLMLFAGKEEGSVDIEICLPFETLQNMGKDEEFMDAVSVTT